MTAQLKSLLERVEKAERPSRELDGRIAWALGWRFNGGVTPDHEDFKDWPDIAGHWHKPGDRFASILNKVEYRSETEGFPSGRWDDPPAWTASIDAAVSLIKKQLGWKFRCGEGSGEWRNGVLYTGWAHLNKRHSSDCDRHEEATGWAHTVPLALIAALLKALIANAPAPSRGET